MNAHELTLTHIGGPTVLLEFGGVRLLTDPTFDPAGGEYPSGPATLRKLAVPAIPAEKIGSVDYILLSHDHHFDNLDRTGRAFLPHAKKVLTTEEGAERLGANSVGLKPWQTVEFPAPGDRALRVAATPARHGPDGLKRGEVVGFVVSFADAPDYGIYISGDTVWYEGVAEVARAFPIRAVILHLGAASVPEVGPFHLTMTATEGVEAARTFSSAMIIPVHYEGWAHFAEGRTEIARAFAAAGIEDRLRWLEPGQPTQIGL
ncbi:MAG TPA: MBL fold metallo-hydrolase [Bryobacteraceae bacterium]|nr:MBL fold metallo-hydrolase [Bryobacteraceae bacterium]